MSGCWPSECGHGVKGRPLPSREKGEKNKGGKLASCFCTTQRPCRFTRLHPSCDGWETHSVFWLHDPLAARLSAAAFGIQLHTCVYAGFGGGLAIAQAAKLLLEVLKQHTSDRRATFDGAQEFTEMILGKRACSIKRRLWCDGIF